MQTFSKMDKSPALVGFHGTERGQAADEESDLPRARQGGEKAWGTPAGL